MITAMLIAALATIATTAIALERRLTVRHVENVLQGGQAARFAVGAEHWARDILRRDRLEGTTDHHGESWAQSLPPVPVEGGTVTGEILDLQGRFNLNALAGEQGAGTLARERFRRLLERLDLDPSLADAVVDWIDADAEPTLPLGAEDGYYLGLDPAYRAANGPFVSITELRLVKGVTGEVFERLAPFVAALPGAATTINVNTAPAPVLAALAAELDAATAARLVETRQRRPYDSLEAFLSEPAVTAAALAPEGLAVSSAYFRVRAYARVGRGEARLASVVRRGENGDTRVLRRSRGWGP